jgi:hypothetical protein
MTVVETAARAAKAAGSRETLAMLRAQALYDLTVGRAGVPTVELHVVAPLDTVLGLAEMPGELPEHGPIPADVIRQLAQEAAVRLLTCDGDTGRLLDLTPTAYRPGRAQVRRVRATWVTSTGPYSTVSAERCDLDHHKPFAAGGQTTTANLNPVDRRTHRLKTNGILRT